MKKATSSKRKFIKFENVIDKGRISRGNFILFIKWLFPTILSIPTFSELAKKFHGINPLNKKIEKSSIGDLKTIENTKV